MSTTDYDWRRDTATVKRGAYLAEGLAGCSDRLAAHIESLEADVEALVEAAKNTLRVAGGISLTGEPFYSLKAAIARTEGSTP